MQRFGIAGGSSKQAKTAHSFLTTSTGVTGTQCSIKGGVHDEEEGSRRH
jgi:hypothetical protein